MRDSTFQRIIGDPDFDPHGIIEDALVEFIRNHPQKVAQDRVALKWLVKDPTIIESIVKVVDLNDLEMLEPFLESVEKHDGYQQTPVKNHIIAHLTKVKPENIDAVFTMVVKAWNPRPKMIPTEFLNHLRPEQINEMTQAMLDNKGEMNWDAEDWKEAIRTAFGTQTFVDAFVSSKVTISEPIFPIISQIARSVAGTPDADRLLHAVDRKWDTYVCFACGYGANLSPHHYRRRAPAPKLIKSLSGYTLHRQKCDPKNEFLSPHEIITGKPKQLEFSCDRCGETFTTLSGLTLHRKVCV